MNIPIKFLCAILLTIGFVSKVDISAASEKIGIALLHGKGSFELPSKSIGSLRDALNDAGYLTELPNLPWERDRKYDVPIEEFFKEIDGAVSNLRKRGATKIVVAGHSMGGNIGMAYAARGPGVAGLIVIAPGHVPDSPAWRKMFADHVAKAKSMIAIGKGREFGEFADRNQGTNTSITVRADIYLSYFDPDGLAGMRNSASRLKPETRVLWIVEEKRKNNFSSKSLEAIPSSVATDHLIIDSSHRDAPENSIDAIISWLKKLP